jgi:8-oxo-dGTP pyrophosphatase MutT (NUDIX family)
VNSNENDYACSIRETKEEIGIDLDKCAFSLGRLPQNIFAYFMKDDR